MKTYETLVELLDTALEAHAERPLFGVKDGGSWRWSTFADFGESVARLAASLRALGVGPGDKVAIIANNRVEWAVGCYASFRVGAAYVPMYEAQASAEWQYILGDSGAKLVLAGTDAIATEVLGFTLPALEHVVRLEAGDGAATETAAREAGKAAHTYASLVAPADAADDGAHTPAPDDLACLIYTSGTTGKPKGVMLSHRNIAANVSAAVAVLPVGREDRSLSFLPWAHVFGQTAELHVFLAAGASMALAESVKTILPNLAEVHPTVLVSVPRIFNRIYTAVQGQLAAQAAPVRALADRGMAARATLRDGRTLGPLDRAALALADRLVFAKVRERFGGRLRFAISGGAALSPNVAELMDGLGITVYEGYGLTETAPVLAVNRPGDARIGTVGKPLPNVRIELSPEFEIIAYGDNIMRGYFNMPEETARVMTEDGGFRTGDMGRFEDGFLVITGRIKEQYKLENGKYVVPTPLEEQLKLSPLIANAMVYGQNRPYNIAVLVPEWEALEAWAKQRGLSETGEALLARDDVNALYQEELGNLNQQFKGYELIRDLVLIPEDFTTENGMLTPSMKLKRSVAAERYAAEIDRVYAGS